MTEKPNQLTTRTLFLALLAGILGLAVAFSAGAAIAMVAANTLHIGTREGERDYFAVGLGLLLGLLGYLGTLILTLRWRGLRGAKIFLGLGLVLFISAAVAAAGLGTWYSFQPHILNANGPTPQLEFEIMRPADFPDAAFTALTAELNTERNGADATWHSSNENSTTSPGLTRTGSVPLYFRTAQRLFVIKPGQGSARIYKLRLPANPLGAKFRAWSAWQRPDFVDQPGREQPLPAGDGPDLQIRYKVDAQTE